MNDKLRFDPEAYQSETCTLGGRTIAYRAWEGLAYCESPLDPIQRMNVFAPESLYDGTNPQGYTDATAPIFMPNTVGGYMPGPAGEPGLGSHGTAPNSLYRALEHGYVVASAGVRGRTSGKVTTEFFEGSVAGDISEATGRKVGRAPAFIVDYKAAIRYLRHNTSAIPGNVERIVTNGTSAGGALSALAGATGNAAGYGPYLEAIGAANERDDVWAASCYCPIHNLENADAAYEWLFCGHDDYVMMRFGRAADGSFGVTRVEGTMTPEQVSLSALLKGLFPAYVNGLGLRDPSGTPLTLDVDGEGSFKGWVKRWLVASANRELQTHDNERNRGMLMTAESHIDEQDYLIVEDGHVTDIDWDGFVTRITRMKPTPAFDAVDLSSPENEEFGDERVDARHFSAFSMGHNKVDGAELADPSVVRLMNPVPWISEGDSDVAPHWRVRHGSFDRDTSLAIPVILATTLQDRGHDVDFALPWGLPHSGDYDLDELFTWIDSLA